MSWWSILKQMDYNKLSPEKKELIKREMLNDVLFFLMHLQLIEVAN